MATEAKCPPRRPKCAATTRELILEAARARFLQENYDRVGLRDIARDAGVDVALINRYFGSKEGLFISVLRGEEHQRFDLPADAAALPDFFLSLIAQDGSRQCGHQRDKLMFMLRSADSPAAQEAIQASFRGDVLEPLAKVLEGDDADLRARLMMALLIGTNFLGNVMSAPVKQDAAFERRMRELLETIRRPNPSAGS